MSKFLSNVRVAAHKSISRFLTQKEEGASLVEYGLLVALIACACIVAIGTLGTSISGLFTGVAGTIGSVPTGTGS